jgi:NADH:ubiquinone oxidoreductase subunit F (NADH-binding)
VPNRFVAGEETALLRALAGGSPKPTTKPPYPFERGFRGRPTLVQNVETLAHLALLARFGARWFGRGTALITLSGAVARPGVHEVPLGTTLDEAVSVCGGTSGAISAYLVGGYFGMWVAAADASRFELTSAVLGAGAIIALPASTCAAAECARVLRYLAAESAGQCGPCVHGLRSIADAAAVDARGDRRNDLQRWAAMVTGRGACRHPDGAARFLQSSMTVFADEFARHARHRGCGRRCLDVLPVTAQS